MSSVLAQDTEVVSNAKRLTFTVMYKREINCRPDPRVIFHATDRARGRQPGMTAAPIRGSFFTQLSGPIRGPFFTQLIEPAADNPA